MEIRTLGPSYSLCRHTILLRGRWYVDAVSDDFLIVLFRTLLGEMIPDGFQFRLVVVRNMIIVVQTEKGRDGNFRPVRILRFERLDLFAQPLDNLLLRIKIGNYEHRSR